LHGERMRPELLIGPSQDLVQLTQALVEIGYEPRSSAITHLMSAGYLDAQQREFLATRFGATISERFSVAEIFGGATAATAGDPYVLDPHVIGEVVDEGGARVALGGIGELTLTELYPYVQMQPLIRYRTGDLVRLVDDGEEFTFEWLGRTNDSLRISHDGRAAVLAFRAVSDLLSREPTVARGPARSGLTLASLDLGFPAFVMTAAAADDVPVVTLSVWLRHRPDLYLSASQALVDRWWESLASLVEGDAELRLRIELRHRAHLVEPLDTHSPPELVTPPQRLGGTPGLLAAPGLGVSA
jgi:hypothetical protein